MFINKGEAIMKFRTLLAIPLIAISPISQAEVENYVIDTKGAHASIRFQTKHLGYSWLTGRFNEFSGTFSYDTANPAASKITVNINVNSIDSNHAERDKHLRSDKYLDTEKFPDASFVSTGIAPNDDGTLTVTGNFTLRGVTREISFEAKQVGTGNDPWGGYRRGFEGSTTLTFADYGYTFDLGPMTKTVEISLNIEGIRQ
jgi:polyisoprenoid-binding protein YceI